MTKLKHSLLSMLLLSFASTASAGVLLQEEFNSSAQYNVVGSGVSLIGGKANFTGAGSIEFKPITLPPYEVNDFEVSMKVKFNSLTDSARFAYHNGSYFFMKSGKNLIAYMIVGSVFEKITMYNVFTSTTTEYAIRLRVTPTLATVYVNNVEAGKKALSSDVVISENKVYIGGTPGGNYLKGTMDSFVMNDMTADVVAPGPSTPTTDPSVNSPDARFVSPSGNDANNGSITKPYKTLNAAISKLLPGNILFVRAGTYRESVHLMASGTPEKPIIIKNYPNEVAILNGGMDLKSLGLKKLLATEPALAGNPNWKNFYKVVFPLSMIPAGQPELIFGNRFMKMAQTPNRPHDVFMKGPDFMPITLGEGATTYIQHPMFSGKATNYWTGKVLNTSGAVIADYKSIVSHWTHAGNNEIKNYPITASSADKISAALEFKIVTTGTTLPDGFAIINHPSTMDEPGEFMYYVDASGNVNMYVWPYDTSASDISLIVQLNAIRPGKSAGVFYGSHVKIDGLQIRNYGVAKNPSAGGIMYFAGTGEHTGLEVRNTVIENIVGNGINLYKPTNPKIINNVVSKVKSARGITVGVAVNARIIGNSVELTEHSCIYTAGSTNTLIMSNYVGTAGLHGNGISAYQGDKGVVIYRNRIDTKNLPITVSNAIDVTILSNILATEGTFIFSSWGDSTGHLYVFNNLLYTKATKGASVILNKSDLWSSILVANNITVGGVGVPADKRKHNIYMRFQAGENLLKGWVFGTNEFDSQNAALLFKDAAAGNFAPLITSPSVDKGMNISSYLPHSRFPDADLNLSIDGVKRGTKPDIGPYELTK